MDGSTWRENSHRRDSRSRRVAAADHGTGASRWFQRSSAQGYRPHLVGRRARSQITVLVADCGAFGQLSGSLVVRPTDRQQGGALIDGWNLSDGEDYGSRRVAEQTRSRRRLGLLRGSRGVRALGRHPCTGRSWCAGAVAIGLSAAVAVLADLAPAGGSTRRSSTGRTWPWSAVSISVSCSSSSRPVTSASPIGYPSFGHAGSSRHN
jgi:hypothetical protein